MRNVTWLIFIIVFILSVATNLYAQSSQDNVYVVMPDNETVSQQVVSIPESQMEASEVSSTASLMQYEAPKSGFARASEATWNGIKAASKWTWNGFKKGCFYTKEGFISVCEKTGLKAKPEEIAAHERIVQIANKSLVESETRREIRQSTLLREKNN